MTSLRLTLVALFGLFLGVGVFGSLDASLTAKQLPSPTGTLYSAYPPMDAPMHLEDLVPVTSFRNISANFLVAANNTISVTNTRGVATSSFRVLAPPFAGAINIGVGLFGSGNNELVVFAGPAGPSPVPMRAFALGPPHVDLGEFGQVPGQEHAGTVVVSGNLTADATQEIVIGTGRGIPSALHLTSLANDDVVTYYPFTESFTGGLTLAIGNLDGVGYPELIIGQASQGRRLLIVSTDGRGFLVRMDGEPLPEGTDGVFPTVFDFNNDGTDELVVSPGSGPPVARALNFKIADNTGPQPTPRVIFSYNLFDATKTNGVRTAVGLSQGNIVLAAATLNELVMRAVRTGPDPFASL